MSEFEKIKFTVVQSEKDYQLLDFKILGDGLIKPCNLNNLELPQDLISNKGVVISGKAPIWLYAYIIHELHSFAWIATFDPRIGAVVVQNHIPQGRNISEIIPIEEIQPLIEKAKIDKIKVDRPQTQIDNLVVVIGGPPHSGKSVFIQALRNNLREMEPDSFNENVYIIRACPDGEGDWFGDLSEEQGKIFRYSNIFTNQFAEQMAEAIENTSKTKKIVIVDVGGKLDRKNNLLFSKCNSGIIVSSNPQETIKWIGAYEQSELKLLATINSKLEGETKVISNDPLEIDISNLDRNKVKDIIIPQEIIEIFYKYL